MTNPKARRKKGGPVTVVGKWVAMPLTFLQSRACASLSPHASKLFLDLCSQFGSNGWKNGALAVAPRALAPRGWSSCSNTTRRAAIAELIEARVLVETRGSNRRRCAYYALTLWDINTDEQIEVSQGAYSKADWAVLDAAVVRPEYEHPDSWATWKKLRQGETPDSKHKQAKSGFGDAAAAPPLALDGDFTGTATAPPPPVMGPPRSHLTPSEPSYETATVPKPLFSAHSVRPPRSPSIDTPSPRAKGTAGKQVHKLNSKGIAVEGSPSSRPRAVPATRRKRATNGAIDSAILAFVNRRGNVDRVEVVRHAKKHGAQSAVYRVIDRLVERGQLVNTAGVLALGTAR